MEFKTNHCYQLKVNRSGRDLTYKAKVLDINQKEIKFETFSCHIISFDKKEILSSREIDCPKQDKNIKITTRKFCKELTKSPVPKINP